MDTHPYENCGKYIRIDVEGTREINPSTTNMLWDTVRKAASEFDCVRFLIEGPVGQRNLSVTDMYESGERPLRDGIIGFQAAFCLPNYQPDDLTDFFITVAANRGARIAFFSNWDEAIAWLTGPT